MQGAADTVSFRAASYADCRAPLLRLRNANRSVSRDGRYTDWRYTDRPNQAEPIVVWAETGTEGVGMLSVIPHHYSIRAKAVVVGVVGDISVSQSHRGKGIAQDMLRYLHRLPEFRRFDLCVVLPNEGAARALRKCGWLPVARIHRYVKMLDIGDKLSRRMPDIVAKSVSHLVCTLLGLGERAGNRYTTRVLDTPDEAFDQLWTRVDRADNALSYRDARYVRWRFTRHPDGQFQLFCLFEGNVLRAYLAFRNDGKECRIEDLLSEQGVAKYLLSRFAAYVRAQAKCRTISIKTNSPVLFDTSLWKLGFIKRPDFQLVMAFPSDWAKLSDANWYFTAADKDI